MRIRRGSQKTGSVLMVAVLLMVIIGVTLTSYLGLVSNQNLSTMRSMQWNKAIPVAEAGIEEAMAHLNLNSTNRTKDGWAIDGTNVWKERYVGSNKFKVFINIFVEPPLILSQGYVRGPKGGDFLPPRTIRVGTTNKALFTKGMVAKGQIDLSGNQIRTDSFDSTDPAYNTGGRYDPAKAKDGGDVATNSSVIDTLNVWNADIFGIASTGPGGNVRLGSNGSVGSKAWHDAGNKGIQPGWSKDDMNVYFPDVQTPFSGGAFAPYSATINGVYYKYVFDTGNYQLSELKMSSDDKALIIGNVTLLVTQDIDMTGNSQIVIGSAGNLQLFMAGQTTKFGGNGVANGPGNANNFNYWGLPGNKEVDILGNAAFVGTVYAPQATVVMGGGGSDTYDFVGALMSNQVKLNGHYNFHYDEGLKKWGPKNGYTVVSWNETSSWQEM